ncbi:conserved hypothetical protein [methanotrophic bacterial endosymbiont of Bathymodiolus sp.]|nr:conserved hypothetical protein [methanotrophic bacterial endosymbiont of Bathymodiolus sp.]
MGVFLLCVATSATTKSLPHARGGVSVSGSGEVQSEKSSPRPWGCFLSRAFVRYRSAVFPTPVGVFLCYVDALESVWSLPHARGGVSNGVIFIDVIHLSSPRPWGCFSIITASYSPSKVFPTPVGVFPQNRAKA